MGPTVSLKAKIDIMLNDPINNLAINVEKQGPDKIAKSSFPLRYGKYSEIKTPEYEFIFNLNGEIKFIRGLDINWPHPAEQLKRTDGNDWVFYTVGDDSSDKGLVSWLGEYYLPCLPYPSNPIWEVNYFSNPAIMNAFAAWSQLYANLYGAKNGRLHTKAKDLINAIIPVMTGCCMIVRKKSTKSSADGLRYFHPIHDMLITRSSR